jgi:hypothetical protein
VANKSPFDSEQFIALSVSGRISLCKEQLKRAHELADAAEPKHRAAYLDLAKQWLALADEMARTAEIEEIKSSH